LAIGLFFTVRPKNGGPLRIKHGIGVILAVLGALSIVGELFIGPAIGDSHVSVASLIVAAIFIAVGMFLARNPKPPVRGPESADNESLGK